MVIVTLAPVWLDEQLAVFQGYALLPVFRLVNLGMPMVVDTTIVWLPLVYGPLLPAGVLIALTTDSVDLHAGWRAAVLGVPLWLVVSALLAELEYAILAPAPLAPSATDGAAVAVLGLVIIGAVGVVEELLFRGLLQQALVGELGPWPGVVVTSLVYGMMHSGYGLAAEIGFAVCFGLAIGLVYHRTDSLVAVAVVHGLTNVFLFGVIPYRGPVLAL